MAVAIERPAEATTVGRPRRSTAASSTSSCTSVAECTSSTATAARRAASCPVGRRTGGDEDEQRPQALAARGDRGRGVFTERRAVRARHRDETVLQGIHQPGDVRSPSLDDRSDRLGARHYRTVPWCNAMIPPAVRIQPTSLQPAATSSPASGSGPGKRFTEAGRYV